MKEIFKELFLVTKIVVAVANFLVVAALAAYVWAVFTVHIPIDVVDDLIGLWLWASVIGVGIMNILVYIFSEKWTWSSAIFRGLLFLLNALILYIIIWSMENVIDEDTARFLILAMAINVPVLLQCTLSASAVE